jgi:hypothetical protein
VLRGTDDELVPFAGEDDSAVAELDEKFGEAHARVRGSRSAEIPPGVGLGSFVAVNMALQAQAVGRVGSARAREPAEMTGTAGRS